MHYLMVPLYEESGVLASELEGGFRIFKGMDWLVSDPSGLGADLVARPHNLTVPS